MPSGLPLPSALNSRKARAFSLDTSIIEAAGFRFDEGALKHLSGQLPPWMELWMPDILVREIHQHRIDGVINAIQKAQSGLNDLRRHIGAKFDHPPPAWLKTAQDTAIHLFDDQLQQFLKSHNGIVIEPTHQRISAEIFNMYFSGMPPFGGGKDKKHEFPDAAALLSLEYMAAEKGVQLVAVSKDAGWLAYAEQSAHIFCVASLQEFTSLFLSRTPETRGIQKRLDKAFTSPNATLQGIVKPAIARGLISLPWKVTLPRSYIFGFDANVIDAKLKSYVARHDAIELWITSAKNDACVVEMPIEIDVSLRLEIAAYKRFNNDRLPSELNIQTMVDQQFEVKLQMELTGALADGPVEDLIKNISLGDNTVEVFVNRESVGVDIFGKSRGSFPSAFDDMDDDIPF